MIVRHELTVTRNCPVDEAVDVYAVTIETNGLVKVEDILAAVKSLPDRPFQEEMTQRLADALPCCRVTSIGTHSGVKTTVVVDENDVNPMGAAMLSGCG